MPDKAHARAALRLLHNAPASQQPKIRAKANKILGKGNDMKMKQTLVKPAKMKQVRAPGKPVAPKRPTAKQVAAKKAGKR